MRSAHGVEQFPSLGTKQKTSTRDEYFALCAASAHSRRPPVTTLVERLDLPAALLRTRSPRDTETDTVQFAQAALAAAKQEGLQLAVRARYVALALIACLLPIINPAWEQLYYLALLGLF